ncbi:citrate/2-methylcitrate synthase [Deinococcus aquiradiocola]|uniref:citrate synthase (unknown stereospecificity) n=1 Tax=Deinococcus aquiradiocola TaxID=393059 RepID=A0A917UM79_9DEIO|nr:citrate synthase family protein [Deinococcus aquiradiocola]GGJ67758.1 citrate synthase [Deinococcus aquiradiocola]
MATTLTASEATERLGVNRATLYAYVSRGLIRSEAGEGPSRARRYSAEDVETLVRRRDDRRDPQRTVQGALRWGAPLLESELTLIRDGQVWYRGRDAVRLAERATLEVTAGLLWTGEPVPVPLPLRLQFAHLPLLPGTGLLEAYGHALTLAGARDLQASDARPQAQATNAARVLALMFAVTERAGSIPAAPDLPLHERLGRAWAGGNAALTDLLRRALVLTADHELNLSSFTVRCAASSGASLHHAVLAGLCALQGHRHGLGVQACQELLGDTETHGARDALRRTLRHARTLPGFGHPLYPDGDPRAAALLAPIQAAFPDHPAVRAATALTRAVQDDLGERPTVDLPLAVLARLTGGPPERGVALFALGRTVGWLAHAAEEARQGQLIRPRARYVGPPPGQDDLRPVSLPGLHAR